MTCSISRGGHGRLEAGHRGPVEAVEDRLPQVGAGRLGVDRVGRGELEDPRPVVAGPGVEELGRSGRRPPRRRRGSAGSASDRGHSPPRPGSTCPVAGSRSTTGSSFSPTLHEVGQVEPVVAEAGVLGDLDVPEVVAEEVDQRLADGGLELRLLGEVLGHPLAGRGRGSGRRTGRRRNRPGRARPTSKARRKRDVTRPILPTRARMASSSARTRGRGRSRRRGERAEDRRSSGQGGTIVGLADGSRQALVSRQPPRGYGIGPRGELQESPPFHPFRSLRKFRPIRRGRPSVGSG